MKDTVGNTCHGFTLVELLIAMAISGLLLTALYNIFISNNKIYIKENELMSMEQSLRSAMNIMEREIRKAGYSPYASYDAGLNSTASNGTLLAFSYYDDDDDAVKHVSYRIYDSSTYGADTLGRKEDNHSIQAILLHVKTIHFDYNQCNVGVYMKVYSPKQGFDIPDLDMNSTIFCRNLCLDN